MHRYTLEELYGMSPQEFFDTTTEETADAMIAEIEEGEGDVWGYQYDRLGVENPEAAQRLFDESLAMFELDYFKDEGGKLS
jgi:hypothetical protein